MTQKSKIHSDDFGLFVRTGGYVFRPVSTADKHFPNTGPRRALARLLETSVPSGLEELAKRATDGLRSIVQTLDQAAPVPTRHRAGDHVAAKHVGGTQIARVGGEIWVSAETDPQYIAYVKTGGSQ